MNDCLACLYIELKRKTSHMLLLGDAVTVNYTDPKKIMP